MTIGFFQFIPKSSFYKVDFLFFRQEVTKSLYYQHLSSTIQFHWGNIGGTNCRTTYYQVRFSIVRPFFL